MTAIDLKLETKQLERAKRSLADVADGLPKAAARAINRTLPTLRKEIVNVLREDLNVKAKDIRGTLRTYKATRRRLTGRVVSVGRRIPLLHYGARPKKPRIAGGRRVRVGVSALVKKSEGRRKIPGTFVARMPSGHVGVFQRMGEGRLPIEERFGPSVSTVLREDWAMERIQRRAQRMLIKRFDHEVDHILRTALK